MWTPQRARERAGERTIARGVARAPIADRAVRPVSGAWIVPLDLPAAADPELVGGKGAGLRRLSALGIRVPSGFVVSTAAFRAALDEFGQARIEAPLRALPPDAGPTEVETAAAAARAAVLDATFDAPVLDAVRSAYAEHDLGSVAVRSSAAAEDAAEDSYAGEHDSYLELDGPDAVAEAVRRCWASLYTTRAVSYRGERDAGAMAVVVQEMVPARAAGVFMTLNPANGDRSTVACEAVWGLGEPLVSGTVTPDRFLLDKISGEVLRREVADKPTRLVRAADGGTVTEDIPDPLRTVPCLTDAELAELLRIGRAVERAAGRPQDGEFAVDRAGITLLQARPETVWSRRAPRSVTSGGTALGAVLATLTGGTLDRPNPRNRRP
jgi:pyruvate,water dikinase